ncbi:protein FAM167A-like [Petromyzon marinus]|uniref:Protein FAM167A-like n=1 Tax=Petromyzon marinus TaxID=7757 RepID=A0AAJ7T1M6_PETMA|nr:protein FAM167A-like [Petromyzon marinus]
MDPTLTVHQAEEVEVDASGDPPGWGGDATGGVLEKELIPWVDEEGQEDADRDHLRCLKVVAEKMRLRTRRPSYLEWLSLVEAQEPPASAAHRALAARSATRGPPRALQAGAVPSPRAGAALEAKGNGGGESRGTRVGQWRGGEFGPTLTWLRRQLVEMRVQDQQLARRLVSVQSAVSRLKVARLLGSPYGGHAEPTGGAATLGH